MLDPDTNIRFNPSVRGDDKKRTAVPRNAEDFKKVLARKDDPKRDDSDEYQNVEKKKDKNKNLSKKEKTSKGDGENVSLFDLSRKARQDERDGSGKESSDDQSEIATVNPRTEAMKAAMQHGAGANAAASVEADQGKDGATQYVREQPDLTAVTLAANSAVQGPSTSPTTSVERAQGISPEMQKIIDTLAEKVYTAQQQGRMDTSIILRNPPILEGARLTVTEFSSAKGEFNITFDNLTQAAKALLDARGNQDALKLALENKGIVIQMVTTTTLDEGIPGLKGEHLAEKEREHDEESGQQQEKEEKEKE